MILTDDLEKRKWIEYISGLSNNELFDLAFEEAEALGRNDVYDATSVWKNSRIRLELWERCCDDIDG